MTATVDDLERRLFQLETLYEIGRECAPLQTLPDVLQVILSMVMGAFGVQRGIAFVGQASGHLEALQARGLLGKGSGAEEILARTYLVAGGRDPWLSTAGMEVCFPFRVDASSYGAIALGPRLTEAPYGDEDRALLATIVANAAPYLQKVKLLQALQVAATDLSRKVQALAVVNEIALGIATRPNARRLHRFLVERIASALRATEGALALKGDDDWILAERYPAEPAQAATPDDAVRARLATIGSALASAERDLVAPVHYGTEFVGALWLRRPPEIPPFDAEDRILLESLAHQTAIILENSRLLDSYLMQQQEQFRLRGMLEQYLAPTVAERLIAGETRPALEGTRLPVTVLMVDMRGSTELITHVEPEAMVHLLNQYLAAMIDALFHHEGTIDKFGGDAVLGFFGAPERHADDPLRAVRAGAMMLRAFEALTAEWERHYPLPRSLGIGVGIATGDVVVGNIGSAKRLEHTVIGSPVNLAARLTARAPAGTIQVDDATWRVVAAPLGLDAPARARRPRYLRAKGFDTLVPAYRLRAADVPAAH
jgi:class 3 adenylate cyclase